MNSVIDVQKCNCMKFNSKFVQPLENEMVAVALDSLGKIPITGIRNVLEEGGKYFMVFLLWRIF